MNNDSLTYCVETLRSKLQNFIGDVWYKIKHLFVEEKSNFVDHFRQELKFAGMLESGDKMNDLMGRI